MKKIYSTAAKVAISVSLFGFLIYQYGSGELANQLAEVDPLWIVLAIIILSVSFVLGAIQWNIILRNLNIIIPLRRALAFYYTGLFFNNFLLSFIGGDVVRIYDIAKTSGKNSEAISTVFLDRLIGLFTMTLFAALAVTFTFGLIRSNFLIFLTVSILSVICFVLMFLYSKPFAKKFESFGRAILPARFHEKVRSIYNSLNYYGSNPGLLAKLFSISVVVQLARILVHYCAARSIGVDIGIEYFFIFIPIIALLITLPITIGGIGLRESLGVMLFGYAGVSGASAVVFEGLAFIVAVISSLPGGITFIFRKHELKEE